jgi:hypothetical protein
LADIVIDEWLWADLSGENRLQKQIESFEFIQAMFKACDRIVTVKGKEFNRKASCFWKHTDLIRRGIAIYYRDNFVFNPKKLVNLEESSLDPIPTHISEKVKHEDDYYLIQAYLAAGASVLVTTDSDLLLAEINDDVKCKNRDEFVASYIREHGR